MARAIALLPRVGRARGSAQTMPRAWLEKHGLEATSTLVLALVLFLTPFSVPSGWEAWAASGYARVEDGAWDTLWRALWLKLPLGTQASGLLFAGTGAVYIFMQTVTRSLGRKLAPHSWWMCGLTFAVITILRRHDLANLILGTRGTIAASALLLAWSAPQRASRAAFAGLSAASGPIAALVGLVFSWLAEPTTQRPNRTQLSCYAAGLGSSMLARWTAFGRWGFSAPWLQGLHAVEAGAVAAACLALAVRALKIAPWIAARSSQLRIMLRGAPTWVLGLFCAGAWWALFGAAIDAATERDERNGYAIVGAEYTGMPGAWVLHADGESFARHLGARAVGLREPDTLHIAVYDVQGPGHDEDLMDLRRNVYFANKWPEDRVASIARRHPVYLASSPHMPANLVRYTLPERHLWRMYSEPRGANDRTRAMALALPWFPAPSPQDEFSLNEPTSHIEASDRIAELRARVVFLLRTGDPSAKYVALNQLALAAPHDDLLTDLTHACQSSSPLSAADIVAHRFASPQTEAMSWHARFGE